MGGGPRVWAGAVATLGVALSGIFTPARDSAVLKGAAAFGDWRKEKPGVRRLLTPQDLPAPNVTPSHAKFVETTAMPAGAKPEVPSGFAIEMVASGLKGPRAILVTPNGDLFVAETHANTIRVLRMTGAASPATGEIWRVSSAVAARK